MTLEEIIEKEEFDVRDQDGNIYVEYRTYTPDGEDIFTGICTVTSSDKIISLDGDTYSMNDEFIKYAVIPTQLGKGLCCWYESEWTHGIDKHLYKIIYAIPATSEPDIIDKDVAEDEWAYMMNDFEVVYDYKTHKYTVDFETMLCFGTDDGARNWIGHCVYKMTDYMVTHNLSVLRELNLYEVFTQGINVNTEFDSLEDVYAFLKFVVFGFHGQGLMVSEEE